MGMDRRSFMRAVSAGAVSAPTVKSVVSLPDRAETLGKTPGWTNQLASNMMDVQDAVIYDRIRFRPGQRIPQCMRLFCVPVGQVCSYTAVVKTLRHTNMYQCGQLEAPRELLVQRILFAVHPSAHQSDIDAVSSACTWAFWLMQKRMRQGPMLLNGPARAGLRSLIASHGSRTELGKVAELSNEVLEAAHHSPLTTGVYIPSLCCFSFTIETQDSRVDLLPASEGGTGLDLLIGFQGADARGVQ